MLYTAKIQVIIMKYKKTIFMYANEKKIEFDHRKCRFQGLD